MTSLKQKSISGMFWTVGERLILQAIGLIVSIILARLLEPSEFGLLSMLTIFRLYPNPFWIVGLALR